MEHIKNAIQTFVTAGDSNDIHLLEEILHPHFQNIQDGYFAEKGIYVFTKSEYITLVGNKTFGGSTRTLQFNAIEHLNNLAVAKIRLESNALIFNSTIICVCENAKWQVINNTPTVEVK